MEDIKDFKKWGYQFIDYLAEYYENIEDLPVKSNVAPGSVKAAFPKNAPEEAQSMEESLKIISSTIIPGLTHWQHPRFHAYFPANTSYASILGELLIAGFGVQAMIWETSPAAAELEEVVMDWLKNLLDLPREWSGVIQDTASTSTLVALLTARERKSNYSINEKGFESNKYRVYCSEHAHSSIDKAVKIAGFGASNLVKIKVNDKLEMRLDDLEAKIQKDKQEGFIPLLIVAALGTTSTVAVDPIEAISKISRAHDLWLHVDAAYAGNAMILPEFRKEIASLEGVDSFVFNPHKWMFTNFDFSAYFVKDKEALLNTFSILPEYLRTSSYGKVNDYRDWGIQLGRRFRALKLWLVFQSFGVKRMQEIIREHIQLGAWFEKQVVESEDFELVLPRVLNVVVFKYSKSKNPDHFNQILLKKLNDSGKMYISHTSINGQYVLRMVVGNTRVQKHHIEESWKQIKETAATLMLTEDK
jgi:aromatic-L-amino-acid decarboxylase